MTGKIILTLSRGYRVLPLDRKPRLMDKIKNIRYVQDVSAETGERDGIFIHFELIIVIEVGSESQFSTRAQSVVNDLKKILAGTRYKLQSTGRRQKND